MPTPALSPAPFPLAALPAAPLAALLLLFLVLCLGGCAGKEPGRPLGEERIPGQYTAGGGRPLSEAELAARMRGVSYILIGERHDKAADHAAQAALLESAAQQGIRPVLGLEMLPRSRFTPELEDYIAGALSLEQLPSALDWGRSWGFDFSLYSPVFAAARQQSLPIHGLNIPHELRAAFSRKGYKGLSAGEKAQMPKLLIAPLPEQRERLKAFYKTHSAMLTQARLKKEKARKAAAALTPAREKERLAGFERFLRVQSLWDSTMAEEAVRLRARTGRPVFILAGVGHVERGWGIAHRLSILDPGARTLLVMPFSGAGPEPLTGDIFYYSP